MLDAIHKVDLPDSEMPNPEERLPLSEAARRTELTARQIARLTECGALAPVREGRRKLYSADDLGVMALAKRRLDAGIPFEQTVRSFSIYENALREAVRAEVDDFTSGALMSGSVTAEAGTRMIRVSDETLGRLYRSAAQGVESRIRLPPPGGPRDVLRRPWRGRWRAWKAPCARRDGTRRGRLRLPSTPEGPKDERLLRGRRALLGLCPRRRRHCPRPGRKRAGPGLSSWRWHRRGSGRRRLPA